ncbi:MAG: GNAT family N-acetyltransferase [Lysobacterales bacterium]|nr:MAG: GNAT family N-acetyltransferase [Xanthomonadales bacterium]
MTGADAIEIRAARREDAAVVHRLLLDLASALGKPEGIRSSVADIERFGFGERPRFEAVLAFEGAKAVGLAVYFYEFSTWRGQPGVYVQDLYVAPGARGRGLGRDLIQAVRQRVAEQGARYVKLTVYDRNPEALAFYHGIGFESCEDELPLVFREPVQ